MTNFFSIFSFSGAAMARAAAFMALCVAPAVAFTALPPGIVGNRHLPSHRQCSVWQVSYKHSRSGHETRCASRTEKAASTQNPRIVPDSWLHAGNPAHLHRKLAIRSV